MIEITLNGELHTLENSLTISDLLEQFELSKRFVVVEYNRTIIPRHQYDQIVLNTGDQLEIVQMMAGG